MALILLELLWWLTHRPSSLNKINNKFVCIMKTEIDLELIEKLPQQIRRLVPKMETKKVPFDQLNDNNI